MVSAIYRGFIRVGLIWAYAATQKMYGPDGETLALPLLPVRSLTLAQELLTRGVQVAKADQWGAG